MKRHNRQGNLHYHLSQLAEMLFYTLVCICIDDLQYPAYSQINLAFNCFILPLQINFTLLQYINHCEAS